MSYANLNYHLIFGTKRRENNLPESIRPRLYEYMGGIVRNHDGTLLKIGGTRDHVHVLATLHQTTDVSTLVRDLKANSSRWLNEHDEYPARFRWQEKYGAFTVSRSRISELEEYIANQKEHHRRKSFREEFVQFLDKHGIEYDDEYVME